MLSADPGAALATTRGAEVLAWIDALDDEGRPAPVAATFFQPFSATSALIAGGFVLMQQTTQLS